MEDYNICTHFSATAVNPEWDPHDSSFSYQEDALLIKMLGDKPQPGCNPRNPLILQLIGGLDWKRHVAH